MKLHLSPLLLRWRAPVALTLALLAAPLAVPSAQAEDPDATAAAWAVGRWVNEGGPSVLAISEDGSCSLEIDDPEDPIQRTCAWRVEDEALTLTFEDGSAEQHYTRRLTESQALLFVGEDFAFYKEDAAPEE